MEDSFYYKVRTVEADLDWIAKEVKRAGIEGVFPSESKRKAIRVMMANVRRNAESIQQALGNTFVPEFPDA